MHAEFQRLSVPNFPYFFAAISEKNEEKNMYFFPRKHFVSYSWTKTSPTSILTRQQTIKKTTDKTLTCSKLLGN